MKTNNTNKGFTLIELLVVVLIIGILAAIALPNYTKTVEKSRTAEAMIATKAVADAANRCYLLYDSYTNCSTNNLDVQVPPMSKFDAPNVAPGNPATTATVTVARNNGGNYSIVADLSSGVTVGIYCNGDNSICKSLLKSSATATP